MMTFQAFCGGLFCGGFLLAGAALAAGRGEEIKLWPAGAPGSEGVTATEVSKPSTDPKYAGLPANFTVTHYPSIYVFLPPKEKATGAAIVVAPGGGHTQLVIDKEGWEFADWLNSQGIAAFVLKYRLAKAPGSTYTLPGEVYADAARQCVWCEAGRRNGISTRSESASRDSPQEGKSPA
jgi:hypothetical protein